MPEPKAIVRRVYRLHVEYPEGSSEWGWEPEGWDPEWSGDPDQDTSFRWPIEKLYLSKSGARGRARLFEKYGATVTIEASEPVVWASDIGSPKTSPPGEHHNNHNHQKEGSHVRNQEAEVGRGAGVSGGGAADGDRQDARGAARPEPAGPVVDGDLLGVPGPGNGLAVGGASGLSGAPRSGRGSDDA